MYYTKTEQGWDGVNYKTVSIVRDPNVHYTHTEDVSDELGGRFSESVKKNADDLVSSVGISSVQTKIDNIEEGDN